MGAEAWVAIYAAIVATGALALELRRWFASGPKIIVKARPNMSLIDGSGVDREGLLVVDAINRGDAATTIELLALLEFPNVIARWRRTPTKSFIIPRPVIAGMPGQPPYVLEPGKKWVGIGGESDETTGDIQTGKFWVAVYTTDSDRPCLARVPKVKEKKELKNAEQL